MGFLDKVKNMFTEEIEEEIDQPVKKEVMKVEIESPRIEKKEKPIEQKEYKPNKEEFKEVIREVKKEPKSSPIYFDDNDFRELEKPKVTPKKVNSKKELYNSSKFKSSEKKNFRPTPIISPVYGILDKNYQKDDSNSKPEHCTSAYGKITSIDEVRQKAYGKTEEKISTKKNYEVTGDTEVLEDLILDVQDKLQDIPKTDEGNREIRKRSSRIYDDEELNLGEKNNKKEEELVDEDDLFNLIDSMYEKREDE